MPLVDPSKSPMMAGSPTRTENEPRTLNLHTAFSQHLGQCHLHFMRPLVLSHLPDMAYVATFTLLSSSCTATHSQHSYMGLRNASLRYVSAWKLAAISDTLGAHRTIGPYSSIQDESTRWKFGFRKSLRCPVMRLPGGLGIWRRSPWRYFQTTPRARNAHAATIQARASTTRNRYVPILSKLRRDRR